MAKNYSTWVKEKGFAVGDTVTVTRKCGDQAYGWSEYWANGMNQFIGKSGKIIKIEPGNRGVLIEGMGIYAFPVFVLESADPTATNPKNELFITAAEVKFWVKCPGVCEDWQETIKNEFDIYEAETFEVDTDWLLVAFGDANDTVQARLLKRFPKTLAGVNLSVLTGDEMNSDMISDMADVIDNYFTTSAENKIPGANAKDKAITILQLAIDTYCK